MRDAYAIAKENLRRAKELGFRCAGRIPVAVVEKNGLVTVAYVA